MEIRSYGFRYAIYDLRYFLYFSNKRVNFKIRDSVKKTLGVGKERREIERIIRELTFGYGNGNYARIGLVNVDATNLDGSRVNLLMKIC